MNLDTGSRWLQRGKRAYFFLKEALWPAVRKKFSTDRRFRAATLVLVSVLLVFSGYAWVHKTVFVFDEGKRTVYETMGMTVEDVIREKGIHLRKGDKVEPGLKTMLSEGTQIHVLRAVPIKILVDGRVIPWTTRELTVEKALEEAKVALSPYDRVEVGLKQAVKPGMEIKVHRITHQVVTVRVPYPYNTQRVLDDHMERGFTRIVQQGRQGIKERTVEMAYEDGVLIGQKILNEKIVQMPVDEIISIGDLGVISRGGREVHFQRAVSMVATAYDPSPASCGPRANGYTYTGMRARRGVVAVDPRVIPLRSRLYVDGYGFAVAADIGGDIKGNRIDLCFDSHREAHLYGRRHVKVYILE